MSTNFQHEKIKYNLTTTETTENWCMQTEMENQVVPKI